MPPFIHTHYSQATYHCGVQKHTINWIYIKCQPVGRIRGSNPSVEITFLASQGDPTRDMHGSVEYHVSGRVGPGFFQTSRIGSGRARGQITRSWVFADRLGPPITIRSERFYLTRKQPFTE